MESVLVCCEHAPCGAPISACLEPMALRLETHLSGSVFPSSTASEGRTSADFSLRKQIVTNMTKVTQAWLTWLPVIQRFKKSVI